MSNIIETDITKFTNALDEINGQISDFKEMKKELDKILEKLTNYFNYAKSHVHTLDEFIKMKDKNDNLWKQIKAISKRYDDSRMTSMHVMHQNIRNENERLKEKLDETICDYDDIEKDRDETKTENARLHDETADLRAQMSCMSVEIDKLNLG